MDIKRKRYRVLADGEGVALRSTERFKFACCDCGLVHNMVIVSRRGGHVAFAVERNARATAARRREARRKKKPSRTA
jgi:hypothetical protein